MLSVTALIAMAAVAGAIPAPSAGALTDTNSTCVTYSHGKDRVQVCYGFDYSNDNNHLRAYADIMSWNLVEGAAAPTVKPRGVELSDSNGNGLPLAYNNVVAGFIGGEIVIETTAGGDIGQGFIYCHTSNPNGWYLAGVYGTIRWTDGSTLDFFRGMLPNSTTWYKQYVPQACY